MGYRSLAEFQAWFDAGVRGYGNKLHETSIGN
jgi:hypothetical protein